MQHTGLLTSWWLKMVIYCYHTWFLGLTGISWVAFIWGSHGCSQTVAGARGLWRLNWSYIQDSWMYSSLASDLTCQPKVSFSGWPGLLTWWPLDSRVILRPSFLGGRRQKIPGKLSVELLLLCSHHQTRLGLTQMKGDKEMNSSSWWGMERAFRLGESFLCIWKIQSVMGGNAKGLLGGFCSQHRSLVSTQ